MTAPSAIPGRIVAVTGGRDFENHALMRRVLLEDFRPAAIHVGDCPTGVDRYVRIVAVGSGIPCAVWQAAWVKHGHPAGPIRNESMLRLGRPDLLIAFPGGRGTEDCIRQADRLNIPIHRIPLP